MTDWMWFAVFMVGYFILMRWVLPRMGVQT